VQAIGASDLGQLYLIGHGDVAWNSDRPAYCGATDLELTPQGREQAERLADRLAGVPLAAVHSSDLRRALDTAAAIAAAHGLTPVVEPALREVNYGEWEGLSEEEVCRLWPEVYEAWRQDAEHVRIPGGETFRELDERFVAAVTAIAQRHTGQAVAVVAHKSTNRVFLCWLLGLSSSRYRRFGQDNAAANILQYDGGRWRVDLINDTCHLGA